MVMVFIVSRFQSFLTKQYNQSNKMKLLVVLASIIALSQAQTFQIMCNFTTDNANLYRCDAHQLEITNIGIHQENRTNKDVTVVNVENYGKEFLPTEIFVTFTNLKYLYVKTGADIPSGIFTNAKNLNDLKISSTSSQELPANAFTGATRLAQLQINSNMNAINENAFTGVSSVSTLNISSSRIWNLPENVFSPLINLRYLYVLNSKILTIPGKLFAKNTYLSFINFDNNSITSIEKTFIDHLRLNYYLTTVTLSNNICTNGTVGTWTVTSQRTQLNLALSKCYQNYESGQCVSTPTTTPTPAV